MSGATPVLQLPYPVPADTVDVPRDVKALADKLDSISALRPPVVTTLPAAPVDGQECYLRVVGVTAVTWHLRFDVGTGKWLNVGGGGVFLSTGGANVPNASSADNATFVEWATGPSVTLPAAGQYLVQSSPIYAFIGAAGFTMIHLRVNVAGVAQHPEIGVFGTGAGSTVGSLFVGGVIAGAKDALVRVAYSTNGVAVNLGAYGARFWITPVALG